jgi:hypothetical protein
MGLTPNYALPYPELIDTADVPRDVKALADKLDALPGLAPSAPIPVVSVLPAGPIDGQEIYYLVDAANGIIWHLRYRAASPSPYKWEFLGGPSRQHDVLTLQGTASGAYVNLATVGPQVTAPLAGNYEIHLGAAILTAAAIGHYGYCAPSIGAAAPVDDDGVVAQTPSAASMQDSVARLRIITVAAPNTAVTLQYRAALNQQAQFSKRFLALRPVRVG